MNCAFLPQFCHPIKRGKKECKLYKQKSWTQLN